MPKWTFHLLVMYLRWTFWTNTHNMPIMWEAFEITEYVEKNMLPIAVKNGNKGNKKLW